MKVCWQSLNKHAEGISAKRAEENVKVLVLELVELWTKGNKRGMRGTKTEI